MIASRDELTSFDDGSAPHHPLPLEPQLVIVRISLYSGAQSVVDKQGRPLPVHVIGEATYQRTLQRIGGVHDASCAYVDGSGASCGRPCIGQVVELDGLPYCVRHGTIVEAMAALRGTVFEIAPPPEVEDRGFNLLTTLMNETGPRVMALLHSRFQERGLSIAADASPRRIRNGSGPEWEQGWWAVGAHPVTRLALRVSASSLPEVSVMVDRSRRATLVPDWTETRVPAGRRALWHKVVHAVRHALDDADGRRVWAAGS
jgi:hypothetical protein